MPHVPLENCAVTLKRVQYLERCAALLDGELKAQPPPTMDEEIAKAKAIFEKRAQQLRALALRTSASGMQEA